MAEAVRGSVETGSWDNLFAAFPLVTESPLLHGHDGRSTADLPVAFRLRRPVVLSRVSVVSNKIPTCCSESVWPYRLLGVPQDSSKSYKSLSAIRVLYPLIFGYKLRYDVSLLYLQKRDTLRTIDPAFW